MSLVKILKRKYELEQKLHKVKKLSTQFKISSEIRELNKLIDKKFKIC